MKKNILIPYEKYEKLMAQSKVDTVDGQCVSHTHHTESNRDKMSEYGVRIEKEKDDQFKSNLSFGIQKGEGGVFEMKANAVTGEETPPTDTPPSSLSPNGRESKTINSPTLGGGVYSYPRGPPGRRERIKKKRKWEEF